MGPLLNKSTTGDPEALPGLQIRGRNAKPWTLVSILIKCLAALVALLYPTCHMLIFAYLWRQRKSPVDKVECTCSCWDSIFKGPYENGLADFKHVYFNIDENTFKIWTITVALILFLNESFKHLFLSIFSRRARWTMIALFLNCVHSNYYGWWMHWNYWNDDFYEEWYHQAFFSITELISTAIVLNYVDSRKEVEPLPMLAVFVINLFHVMTGAKDNFLFNVLQGKGHFTHIWRDLAFMSADILHVAVALYEIKCFAVRKQTSFRSVVEPHLQKVLIVMLSMLLLIQIFPSE